MLEKTFDVLLAGYYGFGNLGDELLAESCIMLLAENGVPKERIAILSADPKATEDTLKIKSYDRWSMSEVNKALRNTETLLLGGGGLFQDRTSLKSLVYYWSLVRAARFHSVKPWAMGQSIGPLDTIIGSYLAKKAFGYCQFRNVRNRGSLGMLNNWGYFGTQSPDLVMSMEVKKKKGPERLNRLLLNLRAGHEKTARLAVRGAQKASEEKGLKIVGVSFSEGDIKEFETHACKGTLKLDNIIVVKTLSQFEGLLDKGDCAIGMRLHFLILSLLAGLPIQGAPYDPKVISFCKEWNVPVVGSGAGEFSYPPEPVILGESAERVSLSFREGLSTVLGGKYGKK